MIPANRALFSRLKLKIHASLLGLAMLAGLVPLPASAFSLLGPFEEWQTPALGYNVYGADVGAPKRLEHEYRWNLPVITYGFDRSFLDYFGLQGVAEVEQAIKVLNALPPASVMDLDSFPMQVRRTNFRAKHERLMDLKSYTLSLLVQQLGLAHAERFIWNLAGKSTAHSPGNYTVINLNYDPVTWEATPIVNQARYTYAVIEVEHPPFADAAELMVQDPAFSPFSTVSSFIGYPVEGVFFSALTRDDAGGLRYLLHPANLNYEPLPSGVTSAGDDPGDFVNAAVRPGRNKILFQPVDPNWERTPGWTYTLEFDDRYLNGTQLERQTLRRTITVPDILFSVNNLRFDSDISVLHSATFNFAKVVDSDQPGPGIIEPPARLVLANFPAARANLWPEFFEDQAGPVARWGSFAGTTNPPVIYPAGITLLHQSALRVELDRSGSTALVRWIMHASPTIPYTLQCSDDLTVWRHIETIETETGYYSFTTDPRRRDRIFFRVVSRSAPRK